MRKDKHMSWEDIADEVVNLQGDPSTADTVKRAYKRFSVKLGQSKYQFKNCGRKPWKLTSEIKKWIIQKLLQLRKKTVCTSTSLQSLLAREKGVKVSSSAIRKVLLVNGYKWKPRSQKRAYGKQEREKRMKFCRKALRMPIAELEEKLTYSSDGVLIPVPPQDPVDFHNFCWSGVTHMWRKDDESSTAALAGADDYTAQVPLNRLVPMWGGIGRQGCSVVVLHQRRKLNSTEWSAAVTSGKLTQAIRSVKTAGKRPWHMLCDGEKFLHSKMSVQAMTKCFIKTWQVPPRSPDLNPVERFWAWLRAELRRRDLDDLCKKRMPLGKTAYKQRIRAIMRSAQAQKVASNIFASFRKTCQKCIENDGHHTGK